MLFCPSLCLKHEGDHLYRWWNDDKVTQISSLTFLWTNQTECSKCLRGRSFLRIYRSTLNTSSDDEELSALVDSCGSTPAPAAEEWGTQIQFWLHRPTSSANCASNNSPAALVDAWFQNKYIISEHFDASPSSIRFFFSFSSCLLCVK